MKWQAQIGWMVAMEKHVSEQVPTIPLYFGIDRVAHTSELVGPTIYAGGGSLTRNLNEWDWRPAGQP